MLQYNKNLKEFSRKLRKNMTDAEKLIWSKIRDNQLKEKRFYSQKIIDNYIVDFYCPKANLIIELDGGQHYEPENREKDRARDAYSANNGLKVLRFSDKEVFNNTSGIIEKIWSCL